MARCRKRQRALKFLAPQIEVAVAQPQLFGRQLIARRDRDRDDRDIGLVQDGELPHDELRCRPSPVPVLMLAAGRAVTVPVTPITHSWPSRRARSRTAGAA